MLPYHTIFVGLGAYDDSSDEADSDNENSDFDNANNGMDSEDEIRVSFRVLIGRKTVYLEFSHFFIK